MTHEYSKFKNKNIPYAKVGRRVNDDEENAGGAGPDAVLDGRGGALQH